MTFSVSSSWSSTTVPSLAAAPATAHSKVLDSMSRLNQPPSSEPATLLACSAAAGTAGCLLRHAEGGQRRVQACGRRGSSHHPRAGAWRQC